MILRILVSMVLLMLLAACGGYNGDRVVIKKKEPTTQPDDDDGQGVAWDEVAPLVEASCGGCHGEGKSQAAIDSLDRLKTAAPRIEADAMPPGGGLDPEVKAKLLEAGR